MRLNCYMRFNLHTFLVVTTTLCAIVKIKKKTLKHFHTPAHVCVIVCRMVVLQPNNETVKETCLRSLLQMRLNSKQLVNIS